MMKRLILVIGLFVNLALVGGLVASPAYAQTNVLGPGCKEAADKGQTPAYCKDNTGTAGDPVFGPNGILTKVIQALNIIVAAFAVVVLMISGIRIVASNGDSNTVASARQAIIAAVIGLVIAGLSQTIVIFIIGKV